MLMHTGTLNVDFKMNQKFSLIRLIIEILQMGLSTTIFQTSFLKDDTH